MTEPLYAHPRSRWSGINACARRVICAVDGEIDFHMGELIKGRVETRIIEPPLRVAFHKDAFAMTWPPSPQGDGASK